MYPVHGNFRRYYVQRLYKTVSVGGVGISLHKILIKSDRDRFKLPSLWAHKRAKKWLFLKNE